MKPRTYPQKRKPRARKSRPLARSITIDEAEWRWEYDGKIKILSPENRYVAVELGEFLNIDEDLLADLGGWDRVVLCACDDCKALRAVTPGKVKKYILTHKELFDGQN